MCPKGTGRPSGLSAPGLRSRSSWGSPQLETSGGPPLGAPSPVPSFVPTSTVHTGDRELDLQIFSEVLGLYSQICLLGHVDSSHVPTRRLWSERGALKCQEPQPGAGYGIGDSESLRHKPVHPLPTLGQHGGRKPGGAEQCSSSGKSTGREKQRRTQDVTMG